MAADIFQSPACEREDSKFLLNHKKNVSLDATLDSKMECRQQGNGT